MATLVENWTTYLMIGIVVVVGVSQINRLVGASLGILFWIAMAVLGHFVYAAGAGIGFPGLIFPEWVFLLLCAGLIFTQVMMIRRELNHRARREQLHRERMS